MKRIDITDSVYYGIIDKLSIRPSVKEKIRSSLYANSIWEIRDLCMLTEEEAKPLFFCNETLFSGIKDYLVSVGLHFGMTEEKLIDYMDAKYMEEQALAIATAKSEERRKRLLSERQAEQAKQKTELEKRRKKEEADNDRKFMIIIFFLSFLGTLSATTLMLWISILIDLFI